MNAALRYLVERPPRTGWWLFGLALAAVLMPASLIWNSQQGISAGPTFLAAMAGLVLGLSDNRRLRMLVLIAGLLVPLLILGLVPPPSAVLNDLGALLTFRGPRPPFVLPLAVGRNVSYFLGTLQAAWQGDGLALNWTIERLCAMLGFIAALLLGRGLRRGVRLIEYALPLLMATIFAGIMARTSSYYMLAAVFPALLVCVAGGFLQRERSWERMGVDYSRLLRSDVTATGGILIAVSIVCGLLTPTASVNPLTRWIWRDLQLPAGLARLDNPQDYLGNGAGGRLGLGGFLPGQTLELGRSLQQGNAADIAFTMRSPGLDPSSLPYWRGRILDEYTGQGWTTGPIRNVVAAPVTQAVEDPTVVVQHVGEQRAGLRLRYGLPDIIALDTAAMYEQDSAGTSVGWIGAEQSYTVYSSPPQALNFVGPEALESQRALDNFLILPDELPQRVSDLALQVTSDAATPTARAEAIERYLRTLPYSYEVAPLPARVDAVDQFLFEMRSGYCTYYASAMAIMARVAGIPSRVALGYASGTYDARSQRFVVREAEAHAWPELYIDGQGWTRWEPTPVRPIPARSTAEQPRQSIASSQPALQPSEGVSGWWGVILLVIVLGLLIAAGNLRRVLVPLTPAGVHADLYRWGSRAGVQPGVGDSIEGYARRLARRIPAIGQQLEQVARLLTARGYRSRPLDEGEEHELVDSWTRVRDTLRRRRE